MLAGLHSLPTFAWGSWVPPALAVGYNATGEVVWRQWGDRIAADWRRPPLSWLDEYHAEGLVELAGPFFARWGDPCWREVMQRAIGTYVEANCSAGRRPAMLDTRVLLAGTGLELLAWAILDGGCDDIDATESKDNADRRVRQLLTRAGVGPALPKQVPALREAARAEGWGDGPKAVCETRHRIAHPLRRSDGAKAARRVTASPTRSVAPTVPKPSRSSTAGRCWKRGG